MWNSKIIIVTIFLILSSCCEEAHIDLLLFCDEEVPVAEGNPRTCRNNSITPEKNRSFTVSIDSYSIKDDRNIRFSLFDRTTGSQLIEEVTGPLSDFGSPFTATERCVSYLAHTFMLPQVGEWPDKLLVEVVVTDGDTIYELSEEFSPI